MELCYQNNPRSLFRKYARLITSLTKHQLFRDYISVKSFPLPKHEVALLLPNGYHIYLGQDKKGQHIFRADFSTKARYAPKLYPALQALDNVAQWITNFGEAQKLLAWYLGLTPSRFIPQVIKSTMLVVDDYFPDPDPEVTSVDGHAFRVPGGAGETFGTIRGGAGTGAADAGSTEVTPRLTATTTTDQYERLHRAFFLFDSSSLPDGDPINSGIISLTKDTAIAASLTGLGDTNIDLVSSAPASNTAIAAADFAIANFGTTRLATGIAISALVDDTYNDWTLNATGRDNISKTGVSKFGTLLKWDFDNSFTGVWVSAADTRMSVAMAERVGTSKDPRLRVDHGVVAAVTPYGFII